VVLQSQLGTRPDEVRFLTPPPVLLLIACHDEQIAVLLLRVACCLVSDEIITSASLGQIAVLLIRVHIAGRFLGFDPACPPQEAATPSPGRSATARRASCTTAISGAWRTQLGVLGLVLNCVVLWTTVYLDAAVCQLKAQGYPVRDEDMAHLSPFVNRHLGIHGSYSFALPDLAPGAIRDCATPTPPMTTPICEPPRVRWRLPYLEG
jgi:hypothetical protein